LRAATDAAQDLPGALSELRPHRLQDERNELVVTESGDVHTGGFKLQAANT
jgi:hypothetical protein